MRGAQRWIWLQVEGSGTVSIDYVRVRVTNNRPRYDGWFDSSDEDLDRVWYAGAYTTNLTTIRDAGIRDAEFVYVDGAKRDRLVWAFDMLGESLNGFYAFDSGPTVARNSIHVFSCQQEPSGYLPPASQIGIQCPEDPGPADGRDPGHPSPDVILPGDVVTWPAFTALWVVNLGQYHLYTGDTSFVRAMLPVARRAMRFFADRTVGDLFLSGTYRVEATWHVLDPGGVFDTFTNAMYRHALVSLAELERAIGEGEQAATRYEDVADRVAAAMRAKLWDDAAGAFLVNDTDPLRNHTSDANVWGLISGSLGDADSSRALSFVTSKLGTRFGTLTGEHANDPFMSRFHSTLFAAWEAHLRFLRGDDAGAVDLLRRGFAWIAAADPGTLWERAGPNGERWFAGPGTNNFGSLAHGYSPVTGALSAGMLGIRPTSPGYATWIVKPQPADLAFAKGQTPTPHGPISSRWERTTDSFRLTVSAPSSVDGVVAVPLLAARRAVAMDGAIVWDGHRATGGASVHSDGSYVYIHGIQGTHTFAWTSAGA